MEHSYLNWVEYKTTGENNWTGKTKAVTDALSSSEVVMMRAINI